MPRVAAPAREPCKMPDWRRLPPPVHCGKPHAARHWNESDLSRGASGFGFPSRGQNGLLRWGGIGRSPMTELLASYLPLAIFFAVALAIGLALLIAPFIVAYKQPDPLKLSAYECGFSAFDDARMRFDVRFYLVAILFIIFDLEVSFLFPWA